MAYELFTHREGTKYKLGMHRVGWATYTWTNFTFKLDIDEMYELKKMKVDIRPCVFNGDYSGRLTTWACELYFPNTKRAKAFWEQWVEPCLSKWQDERRIDTYYN